MTYSTGMNAGKKRNDELLGYICCPFHDDRTPSYAIYTDHSWCYGCGVGESAVEYFKRTGVSLAATTIERRHFGSGRGNGTTQEIGSLEARVQYWHRTLIEGPRMARIEWFVARGFSHYQIQRFRFGHTGDHFVIPILHGNEVTGYKWRADPKYTDPDSIRYRNPGGQTTLVYRPSPGSGPIVICEGELDAALLVSLGYDGLTTTAGSGSLSAVVGSLRSSGHVREQVYVATDPDEAGENAAQALAVALPRDPYRVVWNGGGDVSDYLARFEPVERHRAWREVMNNAGQYSPERSR